MNNDKPNAFLYINTKISYLARKPWWSAWGSEEIKKMQDNCTVEHRGAVAAGNSREWNSPGNKHPAEFQVSMIQRSFCLRKSSQVNTYLCSKMWDMFELQISPCPDIGHHYLLLQPKRWHIDRKWQWMGEFYWKYLEYLLQNMLLVPSPFVSRTFLFWSDKSCIYLSNTC